MLKNVKKIRLKEISSSGGNVIKYLNKNNKYFNKFGEIYFTEIKKGFTKGWNLHKKTYCLITVPYGAVNFTVMDFNKKKKKVFLINRKNPSLLVIPPKVWFKFKSVSPYSIITNVIDQVHNKKETLKIPISK